MSSPLCPALPKGSFTSLSSQTELSIRQSCHKINNVQFSVSTKESKILSIVESNVLNDVLQRRLNPKTREDFERLFDEVNQWRDCRLKEIESLGDLSVDTRKEKKADVLSKETKLLRKIALLKKQVIKEKSKRKLSESLNALGSDEVWEMSNGEKIVVETSAGKYASKLVEMHQQLSRFESQEGEIHKVITDALYAVCVFHLIFHPVGQRLEVLSKAKVMLESMSLTPTTKETIDLINREFEFLNRCMFKSLTGLRERLLNLYQQVLEQETGKRM